MSYHWTGNLDEDIFQHLRDEQNAESKRPVCSSCGEPILGDDYWECEPGEMYCEDCKDEWLEEHRHAVPDM